MSSDFFFDLTCLYKGFLFCFCCVLKPYSYVLTVLGKANIDNTFHYSFDQDNIVNSYICL